MNKCFICKSNLIFPGKLLAGREVCICCISNCGEDYCHNYVLEQVLKEQQQKPQKRNRIIMIIDDSESNKMEIYDSEEEK